MNVRFVFVCDITVILMLFNLEKNLQFKFVFEWVFFVTVRAEPRRYLESNKKHTQIFQTFFAYIKIEYVF